MAGSTPGRPAPSPEARSQAHRIRRQVFEIEVADRGQASRLQERLGELGRSQLEPAIDRCLSALCPPDRLHRIGRLELDLGRLDSEQLEQQLIERLHHELRGALRKRLAGPGDPASPESAITAQLELLERFARTGTLPWWADTATSRALDDCLRRLVREAPERLAAALEGLARTQRLRRVVSHADDETLLAVLAVLLAAAGLPARIAESARVLSRALERRTATWQATLEAACGGGAARDDAASFWRRVLGRRADATGEPFHALVGRLAGTLEMQGKTEESELIRGLGASNERAAEAARDENDDAPASVEPDGVDRADVDTSGLVLLWPFLQELFARQELYVDDAFTSDAARHRAVALVHHLATAETEPVEYRLPLAKLLGGLPLEDVFELEPPISEPEADACTELLRAVLTHAPKLGEMSPEGFRGTFLLRPGVLEWHGDFWLLRVERRAYDVVLDRLPWLPSGPGGWLRLPWMPDALQVEW